MSGQKPNVSWPMKAVAVFAGVFGILTLYSGGNVLFGPAEAQASAGNYMGFVVWFNFLAGFFYIAGAISIWFGQNWARSLAWFIAGATLLVGLIFAAQILFGAAFEMRTVGAMVLRFAVWAAIALALHRKRPTP